jgi:hypothetical protein
MASKQEPSPNVPSPTPSPLPPADKKAAATAFSRQTTSLFKLNELNYFFPTAQSFPPQENQRP